MTLAEYLQILPNYTFQPNTLKRAVGMYGLELMEEAFPDIQTDDFLKSRDLAEAVMWDAASGLVNGGGSKKSMGSRSYTDMSIQTSQQDRAAWQAKAKALRDKWGVTNDIYDIFDASELW